MTRMNLDALEQHLRQNFQPDVAARLDAVFRIAVGEQSLSFHVAHARLDFAVPPGARPDATFFFQDDATAWALLSGREDAFQAFMEGRFRSDGYLMWAFALMAMFRSTSLPIVPVE